MNKRHLTLTKIACKTMVVHTVTYFLVGLLALVLLDYSTQYSETSLNLLMRPTTDPLVMAGPLFAPIRGILFGIVFYLLRRVLFEQRDGWFVTWVLLVIVGIVSPFGPAPGSIEGLIFTTLPLSAHLTGQIEVYLQSLLLSIGTFCWVRHPEKKWLNWVLGILFSLTLLFPTLGLIVG